MATVIIQSAGLLTTVQDSGRNGYQRYGMPVSGAMDLFSCRLANLLVGNDPGDACLEATVSGPVIAFTGTTQVAVTGADMGPHINGSSIPLNTAVSVKQGDQLGFTGLKSGCRSYIAFAGGIDVPLVMGSRSTYLRGGIGGYRGRALVQGDELPVGRSGAHSAGDGMPYDSAGALSAGDGMPYSRVGSLLPGGGLTPGEGSGKPSVRNIPGDLIPEYRHDQVIRVIPGPEAHFFEIAGLRSFLSTEYRVTAQSDRMGYRLSGESILHKEGMSGIISAGISAGTVQVPGDGQPVVLMADRQTSGGYARIANVITADLTLLAQMKPGDTVRFREITLDRARQLYIERCQMLSEL